MTCPVWNPYLEALLFADGGIVTTVVLTVGIARVAWFASDAVYTVLVPLAALDTQNGLPAETEIPHVPSRLGSTTAADPAWSAIRFVWTKFVAANDGADNSAVK